jgi:hypothetical protein
MNAFTNIALSVSEGNTVPSIDIMSNSVYVDIGNIVGKESGTVFRLFWDTPTAQYNRVDSYTLNIYYYNEALAKYVTVLNENIGNVNEYYVTSYLLKDVIYDNYKLKVQLTANSAFGAFYSGNSNVLTVDVSKGCGTYIKVSDGYSQPIMKRAIALAKLGCVLLLDAEGKALKDAEGKALYANMAKVQSADTGWALMQDFKTKDSSGSWKDSEILYEVLTDIYGEIILDSNNEPIYTL